MRLHTSNFCCARDCNWVPSTGNVIILSPRTCSTLGGAFLVVTSRRHVVIGSTECICFAVAGAVVVSGGCYLHLSDPTRKAAHALGLPCLASFLVVG